MWWSFRLRRQRAFLLGSTKKLLSQREPDGRQLRFSSARHTTAIECCRLCKLTWKVTDLCDTSPPRPHPEPPQSSLQWHCVTSSVLFRTQSFDISPCPKQLNAACRSSPREVGTDKNALRFALPTSILPFVLRFLTPLCCGDLFPLSTFGTRLYWIVRGALQTAIRAKHRPLQRVACVMKHVPLPSGKRK